MEKTQTLGIKYSLVQSSLVLNFFSRCSPKRNIRHLGEPVIEENPSFLVTGIDIKETLITIRCSREASPHYFDKEYYQMTARIFAQLSAASFEQITTAISLPSFQSPILTIYQTASLQPVSWARREIFARHRISFIARFHSDLQETLTVIFD